MKFILFFLGFITIFPVSQEASLDVFKEYRCRCGKGAEKDKTNK